MNAFPKIRMSRCAPAIAALICMTSLPAVAQSDMATSIRTTTTVTPLVTTVIGEKLPPIALVGPSANNCGTAVITDNRLGPDALELNLRCLKPATKYSLLLTQAPTPGALPAQLVTEFSADYQGAARLSLAAEVVEAFATANPFLSDGGGIADIPDAGARNNGASAIALDWLSVYESVASQTAVQSNGGSVFGHNSRVRAGAVALVSTTPIPNPPLVARLYGQPTVAQFYSSEVADYNIGSTNIFAPGSANSYLLEADASSGDIVSFVFEQTGGPKMMLATSPYRGRASYRFPIDRSYAGEVLTWRLTVMGRNGASSTATLSQTVVRSPTEAPVLAMLPPVLLVRDINSGGGVLSCACFGNIISHQWQIVSAIGVDNKIYVPNTNSTYAGLSLQLGEVFTVRVTATDFAGRTSSAFSKVMAVSGSQLAEEVNARFFVPAQ